MVSLLYLENLLRCEDFQLDFLSRIVGNLEVVIPFYVEIASPDKSLNNLLRFSFLNDQNNIIFRTSNYGDPKNDWSTVGYPIGVLYYATFSNWCSCIEYYASFGQVRKLLNAEWIVGFVDFKFILAWTYFVCSQGVRIITGRFWNILEEVGDEFVSSLNFQPNVFLLLRPDRREVSFLDLFARVDWTWAMRRVHPNIISKGFNFLYGFEKILGQVDFS